MGATGAGCSVTSTITSSELCGRIKSAVEQGHSTRNTHVSLSCRGLREQFRNVDHKLEVAKVDCFLHPVDNVKGSGSVEKSVVNPDEEAERSLTPGSACAPCLLLEDVHRDKRQINSRHVLSRAERIKRL